MKAWMVQCTGYNVRRFLKAGHLPVVDMRGRKAGARLRSHLKRKRVRAHQRRNRGARALPR